MSDTSDPIPAAPEGAPDGDLGLKRKKKDKVRTAWIGFFGRILAQILGAVASVVLGLYVLQNYQKGRVDAPAPSASPAERPATRTAAPRDPKRMALAVLPLANFSGDPQQDYFADGMTEALIADLAQIEGLRVISRTSSMRYKGTEKSLPEVARELDVDLIVEGSVARAGERVRVTAQLIDATSDEHIWARSYDQTVRDLFALQGQVASAIAGEVKGALTTAQRQRLAARTSSDPAAYDLYMRGRFAWNARTPAGNRSAIEYFEQAIQRDPNFALAYAGLADAYSLDVGQGRETKAKEAAQKALSLDERLGEAHTSLAAVLHQSEGRVDEADREFRRALELNPGHATSHQWYAILLSEEGRDAEATERAQHAVSLDPLSGAMHQTLSLVHYNGHRYESAAAAARRAIDLAPQLSLARSILARALTAMGSASAAIQVCELDPSPNPEVRLALGVAYLKAGDRPRADAIVHELEGARPESTAALARWYATIGDRARTLDMLKKSVGEGTTLQSMRRDPVFDPYRSDAAFASLLQRQPS